MSYYYYGLIDELPSGGSAHAVSISVTSAESESLTKTKGKVVSVVSGELDLLIKAVRRRISSTRSGVTTLGRIGILRKAISVAQSSLVSETFVPLFSAAPTWNPSDKLNVTLTNGNLTASTPVNGGVRSTTPKVTGKWYFEVSLDVAPVIFNSGISIGIADISYALGNKLGATDFHSAGYYSPVSGGGTLIADDSLSLTSASNYAASGGNIIGVAIDIPNEKIYWSLNGTWQNSADPASGTGYISWGGSVGYVYAAVYFNLGNDLATVTINFGKSAFSNAPPSGFAPWYSAIAYSQAISMVAAQAVTLVTFATGILWQVAIAVSQASAVTSIRRIVHRLLSSVAAASQFSLARIISRNIAWSAAQTFRLSRNASKIVSIISAETFVVARNLSKVALLSASTAITAARAIAHAITKIVSAQLVLTPRNFTKAFSTIVQATSVAFSASHAPFLAPLAMVTAQVVSLRRLMSKRLSIAAASLINGLPRSIFRSVGILSQTAVSVPRRISRQIALISAQTTRALRAILHAFAIVDAQTFSLKNNLAHIASIASAGTFTLGRVIGIPANPFWVSTIIVRRNLIVFKTVLSNALVGVGKRRQWRLNSASSQGVLAFKKAGHTVGVAWNEGFSIWRGRPRIFVPAFAQTITLLNLKGIVIAFGWSAAVSVGRAIGTAITLAQSVTLSLTRVTGKVIVLVFVQVWLLGRATSILFQPRGGQTWLLRKQVGNRLGVSSVSVINLARTLTKMLPLAVFQRFAVIRRLARSIQLTDGQAAVLFRKTSKSFAFAVTSAVSLKRTSGKILKIGAGKLLRVARSINRRLIIASHVAVLVTRTIAHAIIVAASQFLRLVPAARKLLAITLQAAQAAILRRAVSHVLGISTGQTVGLRRLIGHIVRFGITQSVSIAFRILRLRVIHVAAAQRVSLRRSIARLIGVLQAPSASLIAIAAHVRLIAVSVAHLVTLRTARGRIVAFASAQSVLAIRQIGKTVAVRLRSITGLIAAFIKWPFDPELLATARARVRVALANARTMLAEAPERVRSVLGRRNSMAVVNQLQPPIDAGVETETVCFDYGVILATGVTLTGTPTITCTVKYGTDSSPATRLIGGPTIRSSPETGALGCAVYQQIGNMVAGVTYKLHCVAATTDNQTLSVVTHIQCVDPE